jgi:hypothetical protein
MSLRAPRWDDLGSCPVPHGGHCTPHMLGVRVCMCVCLTGRCSPVGSVVGTLTVGDPDAGPGSVFRLVNGFPATPFVVSPEGALLLAGPLDFETEPSFTLSLTVNDTARPAPDVNCTLPATGTVTVVVSDVAEAPVVIAAPQLLWAPEGAMWPQRPRPVVWFGSVAPVGRGGDRDPLQTSAYGYGHVVAVDPTAGNTSVVVVSVARVVVVTAAPASAGGGLQQRMAGSGEAWVELVSPSGTGPCLGGMACEVTLVQGGPAWDYDVGLRSVEVTILAAGGSGLNSTVMFVVEVGAVNEGTIACEGRRPR